MASAGFEQIEVHVVQGAFEAPSRAWLIKYTGRFFTRPSSHLALSEGECASLQPAFEAELERCVQEERVVISSHALVAVERRR